MMISNSIPCYFQSSFSRPRPPQQALGMPQSWLQRLQNLQLQGVRQDIASAWISLMQPTGPTLSQPAELQRQGAAQVGPHQMQVDAQGNITVSTAPARLQMGVTAGASALALNFSSPPQAPVRFSQGVVHLPNGQSRPYGNTGVLVVMADGRQFGAGRNSGDSPENIRYVAAEKGQSIASSPPGATTVLYLDSQGNVEREERR